MLLNTVLLFAGFVVLIKGADYLVGGASSLAIRLKVSALTIGLTIVAFGTSAPELTVNLFSSMNGRNDAIFGNVIGSNIFNLLLILGITGSIYPLVVQKKSVKYEVPFSLFGVGLLWVLVNDVRVFGSDTNVLSRMDAGILVIGFLFFMFYIYKTLKTEIPDEEEIKEYTVPLSTIMVIGGMIGLVGGGYLVTENAVAIAERFGLSQKLIGLTILAVGTSLPELATSLVAAYKKNTDIAVGNIIGSNIFNIFFILAINGLVNPIAFSPILNIDLMVLAGGTVLLIITMFTLNANKLDRWEAIVLLLCYFVYTWYLIVRN